MIFCTRCCEGRLFFVLDTNKVKRCEYHICVCFVNGPRCSSSSVVTSRLVSESGSMKSTTSRSFVLLSLGGNFGL